MKLYDELKARGLVAQITDEEIIDVINEGKATFYIGFDCTADSLTAGHFMALTLMKRLQMAGNKPISATPPAAPICARCSRGRTSTTTPSASSGRWSASSTLARARP